jgi:hypothetical protein
MPDIRQKFIRDVIETLPFRIFQRLKQIIMDKTRNNRVLKSKKDVHVHWDQLEAEGLLCHGTATEGEKMQLTLS